MSSSVKPSLKRSIHTRFSAVARQQEWFTLSFQAHGMGRADVLDEYIIPLVT